MENIFKKQNNGITLIALVVTVVVLLILAGISIKVLTGDNGIITQARQAKEQTEIDEEKELIKTATAQAVGKDKYGNITVDGLQKELENNATVKKIRKKIVVTINDSQRMYYVDDNGNVFEYEYFDLAIMENGNDFYNRMADYRESILTVTVLDNISIPENAYKVFDVSKEQNETVKAWLVENIGMYDLYIGSNEGVEIEDCNLMFGYYSNCISIDISNLYTENVTSFAGMFTFDTNVQTIDLSNINTSNATSLRAMFNKCISLANIDVSNFDTRNVTTMGLMFFNCAFSTIDVSNFDTSKVTEMDEMFRQCYYIKELDLSNFDMTNVTRTDRMFNLSNKLEKIYVSENWSDYTNITNSSYMFYKCTSLKSEKMSYHEGKTDIAYANYDTGYFTYKAIE